MTSPVNRPPPSSGNESTRRRVTGHDDDYWMLRALTLAQAAQRAGEVPVGAVLVGDGQPLGEGWNRPIRDCDPTAHAEIVAIRQAASQAGNYRLPGTTLYVTLEPCAMCAGAIVQARIRRVVYGAEDPRSGAAGSVYNLLQAQRLNHCCEITSGVLAQQCAEVLSQFFESKRT